MVATVRAPGVDFDTVVIVANTTRPTHIRRVLRVLIVRSAVEAVIVSRKVCIGCRSCAVRVCIAGVGVVGRVPRTRRCELLGRKSSNIRVRPVLCCRLAVAAKIVATLSACYLDMGVVWSVTTLAAEDWQHHVLDLLLDDGSGVLQGYRRRANCG